MATSDLFIHPAAAFLVLAGLLPFLRGKARWLLLFPPLLALYAVFTMPQGNFFRIEWLGQSLELGRVDRLSLIFAQVFAVMSLAGALYALHLRDPLQHAMAALYVAGAFGCVFAGDYLSLFLFWELMSIGSTFLLFCNRTRESVLAGFRYFLYHSLGGLLLLAGLLLRHQAVGTFAFEAAHDSTALYNWLILGGFAVNAAMVPLHAWLPDAYPRGTISGSVFLCAFTTKTAVYVLARGFAGWELLSLAGTIMAVYGVLYACIENNARKILSYHIVSQVGYMVAGIGIGTAMTINGAAAHAYAHILYKGLLFMAAGALIHATGTAKLDQLGALAARLPWVMILYMVAAFSISGMPLFNGFVSKTMTIAGAAEAGRTWTSLGLEIAAVGTFISVGVKLPYFAFWGGKKDDPQRPLRPIPWNMYAAMGLLAALCLLQGLCPATLYAFLPESTSKPFIPWTSWNVLQSLLLLNFSGLAFYLLRRVITPHAGINLDFDFFYRAAGRWALRLVAAPLSAVDAAWSGVYRSVGLRALLLFGAVSAAFDRKGIDSVVDGSARAVKSLGHSQARVQNGDLQRYLAAATCAALLIFALCWNVLY